MRIYEKMQASINKKYTYTCTDKQQYMRKYANT